MAEQTEWRIEHDTMGEVRVPKDAKYRSQTQRAVENFPISGLGWSARTSRRWRASRPPRRR
jgi:fumarate hydratase class II